MANTLTNFLVGVGFDFDKKGAQQVDGAIDGIKSRALQAGAVIAGAFGINKLTSGFADANDKLGKFSQVFGVIPDDVAALGRALTIEGGTLDGFISQVEQLERLRALRPDQLGALFAEAGVTGVDVKPLLEAQNATEAYIALADQFQSASQQQRLRLADVFGIDQAGIRLLSRGSDDVRGLVEELRGVRPVTDAMVGSSAEFNDNMYILGENIGFVADQISSKLLPEVNEITGGVNEWFNANRELIGSGMDEFLDPVAEHFDSIAAAGALLAGGGFLKTLGAMARFIPVIGTALAGVAGSVAAITGVGAAVIGGAAVVSEAAPGESLSSTSLFGDNAVTRFLDTPIGDFFSDDQPDDSESVGGVFSSESSIVNPLAAAELDRGRVALGGAPSSVAQQTQPARVLVELDGPMIERKVVDITDQLNNAALDDITTSFGG